MAVDPRKHSRVLLEGTRLSLATVVPIGIEYLRARAAAGVEMSTRARPNSAGTALESPRVTSPTWPST